MGIGDLLPPSPSALVNGGRQYPSPPTLLPPPIADAPLDDGLAQVENTRSGSNPVIQVHNNHEQEPTIPAGPPNVYTTPHPVIGPFDYMALINQEQSLSGDLENTLKVLAHWLGTIEAGLNTVLDNAIEEENDIHSGDSSNDDQPLDSSLGMLH